MQVQAKSPKRHGERHTRRETLHTHKRQTAHRDVPTHGSQCPHPNLPTCYTSNPLPTLTLPNRPYQHRPDPTQLDLTLPHELALHGVHFPETKYPENSKTYKTSITLPHYRLGDDRESRTGRRGRRRERRRERRRRKKERKAIPFDL